MQDDRKVCEEGLETKENESWECVDMEVAESLSKCLEQVSNWPAVRPLVPNSPSSPGCFGRR